MGGHGWAVLFAILLWWASTGLIIALCALPARTFRGSLLAAGLVLAAALYGLGELAWMTTPEAAYGAFLCALAVWGWLEMSFLMGFLTGPRAEPCPAGAQGWRRFRLALDTLLYHELAILAAAVLIVALSWDAPNQVGAGTFLILAVMRISAKLNIFLGVPNLSDEMMPARLAYLKSYFRKRRFNGLLPVSILGASAFATGLALQAAGAQGAEAVGAALMATLLGLAALEHCFMILPLPDAMLWQWAMPGRPRPPADET
ncbi:putative photosynthetic complex assembly protein PuhE [Zavarzinia sp. CC-PAN008]|uniref:putative photosynthetic complex assembly protein PuhE n=1 Tax=Zavarzinia sp. CC-PAN008 TaxID=3243332 RepID=UPI003F742E68